MRAVTVLTALFSPGDSLLNIFSSSKSITAVAMASLVSGGLVRYEDKISHHWPEFGAGGKADINPMDCQGRAGGLEKPGPGVSQLYAVLRDPPGHQ